MHILAITFGNSTLRKVFIDSSRTDFYISLTTTFCVIQGTHNVALSPFLGFIEIGKSMIELCTLNMYILISNIRLNATFGISIIIVFLTKSHSSCPSVHLVQHLLRLLVHNHFQTALLSHVNERIAKHGLLR